VIADHDEDVRWKKDAATARDLFARAGVNCKVGTDQSFKESQLRVDDLATMMDGNPPAGKPDRDEDFRWSQLSGRPPLMARLEAAEKLLGAMTASQGEFSKQLPEAFHEAEIVAAIAEVIRRPDFEYHDDDSYIGYAAAMRDAAVRVRDACLKKDYETARTAVGEPDSVFAALDVRPFKDIADGAGVEQPLADITGEERQMPAAAAGCDADLARPRTTRATNDTLAAAIKLQAGVRQQQSGEHFFDIGSGLVDELFHVEKSFAEFVDWNHRQLRAVVVPAFAPGADAAHVATIVRIADIEEAVVLHRIGVRESGIFV
jgi:hypothetical protein